MRVRCDQCGIESPEEKLFRKYYPSATQPAEHYCPACWKKREARTDSLEVKTILFFLIAIPLAASFLPEDLGGGLGRLTAMIIFVDLAALVMHEMGHALAAWLMGMRVFKISIGVGRKIYHRKFGATEFECRAIPVSGFVLPGARSMVASRLRHFIVSAAGPGMNLVIAYLAYLMIDGNVFEPVQSASDVGVWKIVLGINLLVGTSNLLPFTFSSSQDPQSRSIGASDGMQMLMAILSRQKLSEVWLAEGLWYEVRDLLKRDRPDEALHAVDDSMKRLGPLPFLQWIRCWTLVQLERYEEAIEPLRQLRNQKKVSPWLQSAAGQTWCECVLEIGDEDALREAEKLTDRMLAVTPQDVHWRLIRTRILLRKGWVDRASKNLAQLMAEPWDKETMARILCAMIPVRLSEGNRAGAENDLKLAEQFDPHCPELLRGKRFLTARALSDSD